MAQPSTQDLQIPFDPTGYQTITGAALAQYGDGLTPGPDVGLCVITTDVAGVPQVPSANITAKWQKYLWIRRMVTSVVGYVWNPTAASDPTLLQWQTISLAAIADGSVTNSKISAGAVTNDKIFSVDWSKITSIPTNLLTSATVAGGDLTGTYPNPTIAANAVTGSKLQSDPAVDGNRAVGTNHIKDANITSAKLDTVTVTPFLVPTGSVTLFAANTAPTGWLECDGTAVSRATFAALFTAIGTTYGAGNGTTTFNIPDMRGYFARGWDHGAGVDAGRTLGSTQTDEFKDHTHGAPAGATNYYTDAAGAATVGAGAGLGLKTITGTASAPNNGGTETRPKNLSFMYIIKT